MERKSLEVVDLGRIVVTGAGGLVGTALIQNLVSHGQTVIPLTRSDCDLLKFEDTVQFFKDVRPDVVFHLAAKVFGIRGNYRNKGTQFFENMMINAHVVEACRIASVRKIVAMGTVASYGDTVPRPMKEENIWLGRPHSLEDSYGHAKRAMLAHLKSYREQYGMAFGYAISTNLYGPNDRFDIENGHVVPSLIAKFSAAKAANKAVEVWGDGSPTRDFLFSPDAADALIRICEQGSGAINVATGDVVTIRDLVGALAEIFDYNRVVWNTSMPNGQDHRRYDLSRLRTIGFAPKHSLRQGLRATVDWYQKNLGNIRT